ncbi:hypothetical protein DPMN_124125 [Dreissena polymorpha]|uniref:Uncharacterized protein n=1 Tax=Dreissena polymorpha TaxID=45954 RepID=A0A9D4JVV8_DREPO|nr:hypothetical protein DPMN_124125 [Dreissena polymorpha]
MPFSPSRKLAREASTTVTGAVVEIDVNTNSYADFHEDRKINVASRVLTRKNARPPWQPYIIGMNLLTKFHEDRTVNMASREKCPAPGGHIFKATKTIFEIIQDIIGSNLLTKFHDDRKINVTSRVLTRKIAAPPWWPYINGMNLLTEFHEDRTINVASKMLTRFYYSLIKPYKEKCPAPWRPCFPANETIFELIQYIIKTNLLTIFHQDWTINVASRVLTRFYYSHIRKNAPPPGGNVFQPTGIIFELVQDIIGMNLLTKFHEDWTINVASRVLTRFYYSHIRKKCTTPWRPYIIGMNLPTKFYEDHSITVASREKCPAHWQPCFLSKHIIKTNLLTKFHEDWTINVASREITRYGSGHKSAGRTDGQPDGRSTPKQYPSASGGG